MNKLSHVILAILFTALFCLTWDAISRSRQEEEAKQQYFPVSPVFNVQVGGHMTYTEIGKLGEGLPGAVQFNTSRLGN